MKKKIRLKLDLKYDPTDQMPCILIPDAYFVPGKPAQHNAARRPRPHDERCELGFSLPDYDQARHSRGEVPPEEPDKKRRRRNRRGWGVWARSKS